jgi:hypothetical protein
MWQCKNSEQISKERRREWSLFGVISISDNELYAIPYDLSPVSMVILLQHVLLAHYACVIVMVHMMCSVSSLLSLFCFASNFKQPPLRCLLRRQAKESQYEYQYLHSPGHPPMSCKHKAQSGIRVPSHSIDRNINYQYWYMRLHLLTR